MKSIVDYWLNGYDWPAQQSALNEYPHYIAAIDGFRIHYLHFRSRHPNAVPLVITHGWPGSFLELLKVAPMLADSASDPFHVVVPSLPGYGFSQRPSSPGMNTFRTAELWVTLMRELGYGRFVAQGGDIGANVSSVMAWKHPESVLALHLNYIPGSYRPWVDEATPLRPEEIAFQQEAQTWYDEKGGYWHVQATQPQTLGFALNDSPVGLAAWLIDKYRDWADCDGVVERRFSRDELLTHISLYWFTETIASSCRMYLESRRAPLVFPRSGERIAVPCGVLHLAKEEPMPPRAWVERAYNVVHWTEKPKGGHFAAWEEPEGFARDMREFVAPFRNEALREGRARVMRAEIRD
jgi:pimeloyl-ACP methyl ester carboxylesterase